AGTAGSGWNYPKIYEDIKKAGQTVVAEAVLQVPAKQMMWTDATVAATNGEHVWFDFRADGLGSIGSQWGPVAGPNGNSTAQQQMIAGYGQGSMNQYFNFTPGALIGKMGGSTTPDTGAAPFMIGAACYNYTPSSPGEVFLRFNDSNTNSTWWNDNSGGFI